MGYFLLPLACCLLTSCTRQKPPAPPPVTDEALPLRNPIHVHHRSKSSAGQSGHTGEGLDSGVYDNLFLLIIINRHKSRNLSGDGTAEAHQRNLRDRRIWTVSPTIRSTVFPAS